MTPEQLVFGSLGVPDILQEKSRLPAAAHRLAVAAASTSPRAQDRSNRRAGSKMPRRVVTNAVVVVASGELDGAIGGFRYQDDHWYVSRVTRGLDLHVHESRRDCAVAIVRPPRAHRRALLRGRQGRRSVDDEYARTRTRGVACLSRRRHAAGRSILPSWPVLPRVPGHRRSKFRRANADRSLRGAVRACDRSEPGVRLSAPGWVGSHGRHSRRGAQTVAV